MLIRTTRWLVAGVAVLAAGSACDSPASGPVHPSAKSASPEAAPPGDIPDSTVYVPYTDPAGHLTIEVPQGWARSDHGAAVVFTDKLNSVRVEAVAATQAPTIESARATDVSAITATDRNVHVDGIDTVGLAGGTAVRISYTADGTPDAVTGKVVRDAVQRYEYFHRGTEAILTLSGPVGADNADPWHTISYSLKWAS